MNEDLESGFEMLKLVQLCDALSKSGFDALIGFDDGEMVMTIKKKLTLWEKWFKRPDRDGIW